MKRIVLTLAALALAAGASAQPLAFHSGGLGLGGTPRGIVAADFDVDGRLDFATANFGTPGHDITVWYGAAGGCCERRELYDLGAPNAGAFSIAAGDLNEDGHPDFAVALADINAVAVFLWSPAGFVRQTDISLAAPANPREVVIADVNRDGHADIAATLYERGTLTVLLGTGDGQTWSAERNSDVGRGAHGLALGDMRGFGMLDAVVTNALTNQVLMAYNQGSGTFAGEAYPVGRSPRNVTLGDFNHDRRPDVAVVNTESNAVTIYLANPQWPDIDDQPFLIGRKDIAVGSSPRDVEAVDANGDGWTDLAVASYGSDRLIVIDGVQIATGVGRPRFIGVSSSGPRTLAIGDFNHDGRPEILIGNQKNGAATLFFNDAAFLGRP